MEPIGPVGQHDGELIEASLADPERFGAVFARHFDVIHRYLARRLGAHLADDLAATVFAEAFAGRQRFDCERDDARPWLYSIATNLTRRHRRREAAQWRSFARHGVDPDRIDDGADRLVEADAATRSVVAVLGSIPARDRDALLLFVWGELEYEQIAIALDVPIGTVRSRINRARVRLRDALGAAESEEEKA